MEPSKLTSVKPSAERVAEVLLRQQDPANWTEEIWAAHDADMCELRYHRGSYCEAVHPGVNVEKALIEYEAEFGVKGVARVTAIGLEIFSWCEHDESQEYRQARNQGRP